ncbi:UNVERIFIED_ORG: phage gpG-like protein [Burkholderia territorii]
MARGKSYSVENPDALANEIAALDTTVSESVLRQAAAAGVTEIKNEIAVRVPRESGDLASGLTVTYDRENSTAGLNATYLALFVGDTKSRWKTGGKLARKSLAAMLEGGNSRMPAHPFVRPAFEAVKQRAVDRSRDTILAALNKKGGP